MAVIQGIVDQNGKTVRAGGAFKVVSKSDTSLYIEVTGLDVSKAFVSATLWANNGDFPSGSISAGPHPTKKTQMIFRIANPVGFNFGVCFRIET